MGLGSELALISRLEMKTHNTMQLQLLLQPLWLRVHSLSCKQVSIVDEQVDSSAQALSPPFFV